ncbi:ATP-binding protein [Glaciimonas sp. PAMC28666]|uniref:ATP-binding protein n=1 Tax=Glaciimonas sp. PAMC28666 TaxID=2807626 RepID=UPI001966B8E3|nr:ATP-binding protein [Glaciimonas sp. PAMC28666]QRX82586.1 response regulator [Glaciimonas sp. PAMC28666]
MIRHDENTPFSTPLTQPGPPDRSSSIQLLGQFHRWILYGGATLFTIVALLAAFIAIAMYAENFIRAQRLLFDGELRQVELTVVAANAKMRQTIARHDFLRMRKEGETRPTNNHVAPEAFPEHQSGAALRAHIHGPSAIHWSGETPAVNAKEASNASNIAPDTSSVNAAAKGDYTSEAGITNTNTITITTSNFAKPSATLTHLLTQFYDASPDVLMNAHAAVQGSYVMLYDKNKTFLGLHASQTEKSDTSLIQQIQSPIEIRAAIMKIVAPIEAALGAIPTTQLRAGKTVWIAPYIDPLSGKLVISRAAVTFHGKTAFSVLVISVPVDQFDQYFLLQPLPAGFAVIAPTGILLSGKISEAVTKDSLARADTASPKTDIQVHSMRNLLTGDASLMTLSRPIRETGWTMVYTFNRAMLWHALHNKMYFALGVALLLSIILWTVVLLFNRLVFIPVIGEALRVHDSEAFNRAMMGVAPLGFFVLNYQTGELMLDNAQARAVASQSHTSGDLSSFHQRLMTCYRNQGRSNTDDQALAHDVLELPAADGTCTYALAAFTRTRYLSNDVLLCCLSDITAQKCAERALRRAKIEADEANKAKSMFLALISHEIRTPLHGAAGHLELLELASLPPTERDLVQTIRGSFESLLRTINDILDISRIEAGQLSLENAPFNVRQTVASCTRLWTPALEAKSVDFQSRIALSVPDYLVGDAGRIVQILNNLLSNSVKFTHAGNIVLDISGAPHPAGYSLQIGIRDSGVGIATEDQKHLFTPFSQANPGIAQKFGGTGLGLSLCKQLTDAMQGKITILSEYGAGTIVLVKLLLSCPSADAMPQSEQRPPAAGVLDRPTHPTSPSIQLAEQLSDQQSSQTIAAAIKILVVEDDPVSRKLLEKQLFALGHKRVDFVDNGEQALILATTAPTSSPYDLILTDMSLPQMSGHALILSLRERGVRTPIIIVSASAENDQTPVIRPHIDAFLTKPLSLPELKAALSRYGLIGFPFGPQEAYDFEPQWSNQPNVPANTRPDALRTNVVDTDVANIFLDTYRHDLRALIQAFQRSDAAALAGRLHRLKGALLAVQEDDLAHQSDRLSEDIRTNACSQDEACVRNFVKALLRVVRHLRAATNVTA